jgi:hypothetical protein
MKKRKIRCLQGIRGYAVAQLFEALRYKVAGSIPDGVIGTFSSPTRDLSRAQRRPVFMAETYTHVLFFWKPQPPEALRVCQCL